VKDISELTLAPHYQSLPGRPEAPGESEIAALFAVDERTE
jgi:hypothetical protein